MLHMTYLFGELRGKFIKLSTAAILVRLYEFHIADRQGATKDLFDSHICPYCMKHLYKP